MIDKKESDVTVFARYMKDILDPYSIKIIVTTDPKSKIEIPNTYAQHKTVILFRREQRT